jgi:hypothetical protein
LSVESIFKILYARFIPTTYESESWLLASPFTDFEPPLHAKENAMIVAHTNNEKIVCLFIFFILIKL